MLASLPLTAAHNICHMAYFARQPAGTMDIKITIMQYQSMTDTHIPMHNLPAQLSSFIGRDLETGAVRAALAAQRLVTLTGAGGSGKTRLALQVGSEELASAIAGVWFVELAMVSSVDLVAHAIAGVFGLREEFGRPLIDTLAEQLRAMDALLIVDNCEHLLSATSSVLEHLLQHCPKLRVLTTSREPLGIAGEKTWRVPSLDESAGVDLFVQRGSNARVGFAPTANELVIIARIVNRLDGIPLAIELAAVRVRMMSPENISEALDDRFRLLTGGSRTAMARQQTLEASVAWSYDHLDDNEKLLARRLSVMRGFSLASAEEIAGDERLDRYAVLDLLTRLVDKSMVQVDYARSGNGYRFLETIRQYLQARLIESGEAEAMRERQLLASLALAERCAPVVALRDSAALLSVMEAEHDNFDSALEFADASGRRELALRLATALTLFWELRGHLGRASRWFARLLDQADPEPGSLRARACWGAAHIGLYGGDFATMSARAAEALALADEVDDDWARARALNTVGFATAVVTPQLARPTLERSIELGMRVGDTWSMINSRKMITVAYWAGHDEVGAQAALEVLRSTAAELGGDYFTAWYHGLNGMFMARRGDFALARTELTRAVALCDGIGEPITGSMARAWLWAVDIAQGEYENSQANSAALLQRAHAAGGGLAVPYLLANLGELAIARGDAQGTIDLLAPHHAATRAAGIPYLVAFPGIVLASAKRRVGDLDGAAELLDDLAGLVASFGNDWMAARIEQEFAGVAVASGDMAAAERHAHTALAAFVRLQQQPDVAATLDLLGLVAAGSDSAAEAIRCFAAAAALRLRLKMKNLPPDDAVVAGQCEALRIQLGEIEFAQYWSEGSDLNTDEAFAYVARSRGERKRPSSGWDSLTPTELRVVGYVVEGLTNPQIGAKMFIARGTVKVHLSHIFSKVEVTSRVELAAMGVRRASS